MLSAILGGSALLVAVWMGQRSDLANDNEDVTDVPLGENQADSQSQQQQSRNALMKERVRAYSQSDSLDRRLEHAMFVRRETGGDMNFSLGVLGNDVRTNVNSLRAKDRWTRPDWETLCDAGVVAQQMSIDNQYQTMLSTPLTNMSPGNTRALSLVTTYVRPFAPTKDDPLNQSMYTEDQPFFESNYTWLKDTQGTIDTNQTLWLRDPTNVNNPYQPFARTRNPPVAVLPDSVQLQPQTARTVEYMLPRSGMKYARPAQVGGASKSQAGPKKRVRFGS